MRGFVFSTFAMFAMVCAIAAQGNIVSPNVSQSGKMKDMNKCNATFTMDLPLVDMETEIGHYLIFKNAQEVGDLVTRLSAYDFIDAGFLHESYSRFDDEFFKDNVLVLALVDRGSSRVGYELGSLTVDNGTLNVNVIRNSPMIQTMDYVPWVMILELCNTNYANITSVEISLETVQV